MIWSLIKLFIIKKEREDMAVIYVALIVKGKRTYSSVPARIKPQVKQMLIDLDLEDLIDEEEK
ncbi:MAG: CD1375 family protein [Firmicutes bacterium]|nr:CD1375 family protein [Bacillota bacterium]